jgi:protoporphyrinogen oxidase
MTKIAVIGAGISGLTCAYELQQAGLDVTVFERDKYVGGRMSTRTKNGLDFDIGANFFVKHYKHTKQYCDSLGIPFMARKPNKTYTYRKGRWHNLGFPGVLSLFKFSALSFFSRFKLLYLFMRVKRDVANLDFYDLSTTIRFDKQNAYEYVTSIAGKEVADIIVDGFTSTYQFHGSKEISLGAMLGLIGMMTRDQGGFKIHNAPTMIALPNALAKKLNVKKNTPVTSVKSLKKGVVVSYKNRQETFDAVVMASTANVTKKIYETQSALQKKFLNSVEYATTINVSYKIPKDLLRDVSILTVAFSENSKICEACNEVSKGIEKDGYTLVNIGLHESYAKTIINKSDNEIFNLVKNEFVRVCPYITNANDLENYDLYRWPQAMPKFYAGYLTNVKQFLEKGQGDNNVFFCGDYLNSPWIEGSIRCGKRVAKTVLSSLK